MKLIFKKGFIKTSFYTYYKAISVAAYSDFLLAVRHT